MGLGLDGGPGGGGACGAQVPHPLLLRRGQGGEALDLLQGQGAVEACGDLLQHRRQRLQTDPMRRGVAGQAKPCSAL